MEKAMIKIAVLKGYKAYEEHAGINKLQTTWRYLEIEFPGLSQDSIIYTICIIVQIFRKLRGI